MDDITKRLVLIGIRRKGDKGFKLKVDSAYYQFKDKYSSAESGDNMVDIKNNLRKYVPK